MTNKETQKDGLSTKDFISFVGVFIVFCLVAFLIITTFDRLLFLVRYHELPVIHSSEKYYAELQIPKSWSAEMSEKGSHWITARSSMNDQEIKIYTFSANQRISINSLLSLEKKLFP